MESLPDLIGQVLGDNYRIVSLINRGAFSAVYKAETLSSGEIVAVKILFPNDKNLKEFYREIAIYIPKFRV